VSLERVSGHRDGDQTDCPGDVLYARLPELRPRVAELAGPTLELTLTVAGARGTKAASASTPAAASGVLRERAGAPIPGAWIEIQRRRGTRVVTVARAIAAADGSWRAPVPLEENATLRAVHRAHPAVISRALQVAVAPAVTLTSAVPAAPGQLVVRGTIKPAKAAATVKLHALHGTRSKLISSTRIGVARGSFKASIRVPNPGTYLVSVHVPADLRNAAGVSGPLTVTV
jgi:hypothetical protein